MSLSSPLPGALEEDKPEDLPGEVREILLYPDDKETLVSKCDPVEKVDDEIRSLVDDLIKTMKTYSGVGLAAPQIGVLKRVAVAHEPNSSTDPTVLINPTILDKTGEADVDEGCLSIPGVEGEVTRGEKVRIRALGYDGEEDEFVADGYLSYVLQHEIDHLDGTLLFDRMSRIEARMTKKRYRKLRKAASREGVDLLDVRREFSQ